MNEHAARAHLACLASSRIPGEVGRPLVLELQSDDALAHAVLHKKIAPAEFDHDVHIPRTDVCNIVMGRSATRAIPAPSDEHRRSGS